MSDIESSLYDRGWEPDSNQPEDLLRQIHDVRNEAQRYLAQRDAAEANLTEALADVEALDKQVGELAIVRDWYNETHEELDKLGAPPGQLAHQRLREMSRVDKISREQVADALGSREALERALSEIAMLKAALTASEVARQRLEYALTEGAPRREVDHSRQGITHHFSVAGHDGYITINYFSDGTPGEVFLKIAKEGSTMSGLLDTLARLASKSLQHNVPLASVCRTLVGQSFEPKGMTTNPKIPKVESIVDYVGRYLVGKFIPDAEWKAYLAREKPPIRFTVEDPHVAGAE